MILKDGFKTLVSFADFPTVKLYEIEVTPPGVTLGGKAIDQTTMRNVKFKTAAPPQLKMLSEGKFQAAYDSEVYVDALNQIGVNQLITYTFPDGSTYAFFGWLDGFTPTALKEGARPVADVIIYPSLQNTSGVETDPVYTAGS